MSEHRIDKRDVIAQRLMDARKHLGWSINDAVEALGYNRSRYTNWELGIRMPGFQEIEDIATVMGCNPGFFVGWTNRMINSSYVVLDRTTVKTSKGNINVQNATDVAAYREDHLAARNLTVGYTITINIEDDVMRGVASKGDIALVDMTRKRSKTRDLFAILAGDRLWVRWIRPEVDGSYTMSAEDSNQYPDQLLTAQQLDEYDIIGRVAIIEHER